MTQKRVALNALVAFGTLLLALLLWEFHHALIIFAFSLAVAAAARPMVERLIRLHIPRGLALVLTYVFTIGAIVLLFFLVGGSLGREIQQLSDALAKFYERAYQNWPKGTPVQQMVIRQLPSPEDFYSNFSPEKQNSTFQTIFGITLSSFTLISEVFATIVLSLYWSIDQVHFERLWLSLLPVDSRARYRDMWRDIEHDFGSYVRSELLQSILAGLLLGVGYWLIGVPYPTLMAIFGAVVWLVPWLGGVLAILPVTLVSFTIGIVPGSLAFVFTLAVLFFLEYYIEPRFIRRRQYSSILNILLILILVQPFGLLGLLIAPPLSAAIELAFRYSLQTRMTAPEEEINVEEISELRRRARYVRGLVANSDDEQPEPQTLSMLGRLDALIEQTDRLLNRDRTRRREKVRVREVS